jgi:hypothetical protein
MAFQGAVMGERLIRVLLDGRLGALQTLGALHLGQAIKRV